MRRYERVPGAEYWWRTILVVLSLALALVAVLLNERGYINEWAQSGAILLSAVCLFGMAINVYPLSNQVDVTKPLRLYRDGKHFDTMVITTYTRHLNEGSTVLMESIDQQISRNRTTGGTISEVTYKSTARDQYPASTPGRDEPR